MAENGNASYPLISIVVATFEAAATLPTLLDSLNTQTFREFEIVVIDGGSGDGTHALLEQQSANFAYWSSEPDEGIYDAWNKALDRVRGAWVLFLGADDSLRSATVLERCATILREAAPTHRIVYGRVMMVDATGTDLGDLGQPWALALQEAHRGMPLPTPGTFFHISLFDDYGLFDPGFRIAGDYEWVLRTLPLERPLFLPEIVVTAMGASGVSSDASFDLTRFEEDLRAQQRHKLITGTLDLWWRRARLVLRHLLNRSLGPRASHWLANRLRHLHRRRPLPRLPES